MSGKIGQPLPVAAPEYDYDNEIITRRQIEQNFNETNEQVQEVRTITGGEAGAALLPFQFLLMGAPGG